MHELSIAVRLVELACEHAKVYGDSKIVAIHVAIGALTQVHASSLQSGFEIAKQGTAVSEAALVLRAVPVVLFCSDCSRESQVDSIQDLRCPTCRGISTHVTRGDELDFDSMEILPLTEAANPAVY